MEAITLFAWICLIGTAVAVPMPMPAGTSPGVVHWTTGVQTKGSTALNHTKTVTAGTVPTAQPVKMTTLKDLPASASQGSATTVDIAPSVVPEAIAAASSEDTSTSAAPTTETVTVTTTEAAATTATTEQSTTKQAAAQPAKLKQRKMKKHV